ncbi:MAG: type II toxin-antitoxin system VapC family toxin [Bacteriovoracia bacterium]
MILADTSVWISHFSKSDADLTELMERGVLVLHPYVLTELACGSLKNRERILSDLKQIPSVEACSSKEVLLFLEQYSLFGLGLGLVDLNLLITCKKNKLFLYTYDKALKKQALKLNLCAFRSE